MNRSVGSTSTVNKNSKKALVHPQNVKKADLLGGKSHSAANTMVTRRKSTRERKLALMQDVDNLKKKLRHEENIHRVLERAFNRPLGALPRLPPYLPQYTLELLAEVAVLEEEVVRLEEQVVNFQQGIYQEAVYTSSRRSPEDLMVADEISSRSSQQRHSRSASLSEVCLGSSQMRASPHSLPQIGSSRKPVMADSISDGLRNCPAVLSNGKHSQNEHGLASNVGLGRSNGPSPNSDKNNMQVERKFPVTDASPVKRCQFKHEPLVKTPKSAKIQYRTVDQARENTSGSSDDRLLGVENEANKLSEDLLKCLIRIFIRLNPSEGKSMDLEQVLSKNNVETNFQAPYCPFPGPMNKQIGSYEFLHSIEAHSFDFNRKSNTLFLIPRLKLLLNKLASVKLDGLNHQQKLAFWINIYNSCIMNAFLEHGIPEGPDMMIMHMQKATMKVGGQVLNALMIEHLILRLPYHLKFHDESKIGRAFGLEWSEPLVTFALSCGSWSSPAVRVYTAAHIEAELEAAKRDYIRASVSISVASKIAIPKLLDWYLLDFAKDLDALLDWVCLQLPNKARGEAIRCLEQKGKEPPSKMVEVMQYNFSFRYLVCL